MIASGIFISGVVAFSHLVAIIRRRAFLPLFVEQNLDFGFPEVMESRITDVSLDQDKVCIQACNINMK